MKRRMCLKCKEIDLLYQAEKGEAELYVCGSCGWKIHPRAYQKSTKVLNIREHRIDPHMRNYVYCGRPSKWGNPYALHKGTTRSAVILRYKDFILQGDLFDRKDKIKEIEEELGGKILGCFCSPKACHCHILAALADDRPWSYYLPPGWEKD